MKKIDVYEVVLKTFGIYLILPIITHIGSIIAGHYMESVMPQNFSIQLTKIVQFVTFITSLLLILISCLCIFATGWIAKGLTKEDDRTQELNLNIDKQSLFQIILLITGLIMTLWALPEFCLAIYNHFSITSRTAENPRQSREFVSVLSKLIIGLFILLSAAPLSRWFSKNPVLEE